MSVINFMVVISTPVNFYSWGSKGFLRGPEGKVGEPQKVLVGAAGWMRVKTRQHIRDEKVGGGGAGPQP